jgi:DnaK suppressor protein
MEPLTTVSARRLLEALEARKAELRALIAAERSRAAAIMDPQQAALDADNSDKASATIAAGIQHELVERHLRELAELEAAERRIESGSLECIDCGGEIGAERLRVNPAARRCMACQSAHERKAAH